MRQLLIASCAWVGMLAWVGPTMANQNLNCDAYAAAAVAQQQQNVRLGCGYNNGAWSTDYNGHRNWCLQRNVAMANLTEQDRGRAGALKICQAKTRACDTYAAVALMQSRYNDAGSCGFTGGRWSPDVAGHRGWCMAVNPEQSSAEMKKRAATLQGCNGQLATIDLQKALQKQQAALQMLSNISKMNHDTSMSVIRKID